MANTDPSEPTKVFVSYSHDSPQHAENVLAFCDRLRQGGIDATLDQYEPAPPQGWPRWMVRQIEDADFVLLVCTETYRRRFEGREKPGRGLGANWEGSIVTQDLYAAEGLNGKFIPVIFSSQDEAHIPVVLAGVTRYRVDTPEGYEALYRYLTHQPAVPRPQLGSIHSLPPRPRASVFPAPPPSSRRGPGKTILPILALSLLISIALAGALTLRPAPEPVKLERQMFLMNPPLAAVSSADRSPDNSKLIVVGKQEPGDDYKVLLYSLEGKLLSEMPNSVKKPTSVQKVGDELLVKDEDVFVRYDKDYQRLSAYDDLLTQAPNGDTLKSAFQWRFVGNSLFALGDVEPEPENGLREQEPRWKRGVVDIPVEKPSSFTMLEMLSSGKDLSGLYLIGYPHFASLGDKAYFLNMQDEKRPRITCLYRQKRRCVSFDIQPYGFDQTPDFSNERIPESYARFEGATLLAGLYGWQDSLYVLTKCPAPTEGEDKTRWFLTRIDPGTGASLYTLALPVTAPHVLLVPGDDAWFILERERYEAGASRRDGKQETSSLVLVPSEEIGTAESPLVVDSSLSLCSCQSRWNDSPPQWIFDTASGR